MQIAERFSVRRSIGLNAIPWPAPHTRPVGVTAHATDPSLVVANPMSADLDVMRATIIPNLLDAATRNIARGMREVALFEVGPQYAGNKPLDQQMVAAGIRSGSADARHWTTPPPNCCSASSPPPTDAARPASPPTGRSSHRASSWLMRDTVAASRSMPLWPRPVVA